MTVAYEIPLVNQPQSFRIQLAGTEYEFRVVWNAHARYWVLDVYAAEGPPLIEGLPLVTGIDLAAQYAFLEIGGSLVVQTDHDPDAVPTLESLGTTGHLFFVTEA